MQKEKNQASINTKNPIMNTKKLREFFSKEVVKALIALIFVITLGFIFNANGAFFKLATHRDTLRSMSVFGILACGMTLVIISGGIDLAVGSIIALVAVTFSIFTIHWGWSPIVAIPAVLILGAFIGLISGSLIALAKLQPFIATLAMMVFARGAARLVTGGKKVSTYVQDETGAFITKELPGIFSMIDKKIFGGNLNIVSVIFFVCLIISWVLLSKHKWGREVYAMGGNLEAARLSGVPVNLSKILVYVYMGVLSAVAGITVAAQETQGDPGAGSGYELNAIAMAVIGGINMAGGSGDMGLTFLGILTISYMDKILSINAVPEAIRLMITGVIIVVAVLAQNKKR
jgi:ribose transport system permease protein